MNAQEFLSRLRKKNILLSVHENRLQYKAQPGAMTEKLRSALKHHKADLIALLKAEEQRERRRHSALQRWPDLMAAIQSDTIPTDYCFLGYDANGGRWECANLWEYARIALNDWINGEEPEELSAFRMDLCTEAFVRMGQ